MRTSLKIIDVMTVFKKESPTRIAAATGIIIKEAISKTPTISINKEITKARIMVSSRDFTLIRKQRFHQSREIDIFRNDVHPRVKAKLKPIQKKVGLVFQFPEYQLFEETSLKDIVFGPKNFGMSAEEAMQKATGSTSCRLKR